jgi:hypothetical protein
VRFCAEAERKTPHKTANWHIKSGFNSHRFFLYANDLRKIRQRERIPHPMKWLHYVQSLTNQQAS